MSKPLFVICFLIALILADYSIAQVTDIDGNQYPTVVIGNQEWMAENLRTSRLNDGSAIPEILSNALWFGAGGMAMCWYNNDSTGHHWPYGRMYNGYVAENPNICPVGWHVPSAVEWDAMVTFLGGSGVAGGKLKHAGFEYWDPPNEGATNSSGFTGLPGGFRSHLDGTFNYKGQRAGWFVLQTGGGLVFRFLSWSLESSGSGPVTMPMGLSIRCLRQAVSVEDVIRSEDKIRVFPNPSTGIFAIETELENLGRDSKAVISDMTGRIIIEVPLTEHTISVDLTGQPAGIYFVKVTGKDTSHTVHKKIVLI